MTCQKKKKRKKVLPIDFCVIPRYSCAIITRKQQQAFAHIQKEANKVG
jgi:hypothetical protein